MALSSINGIGPKTAQVLVARFGTPEKVLGAPLIEIARILKLNFRLAGEIKELSAKLPAFARATEDIINSGVDILCPDDAEYPRLLLETEQFPTLLFKRGELPSDDKITIGVVGTRFPSSQGVETARAIAEQLAGRGIVVVSGLAKGIDSVAHRGALDAGGTTLAVLGSGLNRVYPQENRQLAEEIAANGAVLSECHPDESVSRRGLIRRNRITSGLCRGLVLVEPRRGALNAAQHAIRQNRQVFIIDPESRYKRSWEFSESLIPLRSADVVDDVISNLEMENHRHRQMMLL